MTQNLEEYERQFLKIIGKALRNHALQKEMKKNEQGVIVNDNKANDTAKGSILAAG